MPLIRNFGPGYSVVLSINAFISKVALTLFWRTCAINYLVIFTICLTSLRCFLFQVEQFVEFCQQDVVANAFSLTETLPGVMELVLTSERQL